MNFESLKEIIGQKFIGLRGKTKVKDGFVEIYFNTRFIQRLVMGPSIQFWGTPKEWKKKDEYDPSAAEQKQNTS